MNWGNPFHNKQALKSTELLRLSVELVLADFKRFQLSLLPVTRKKWTNSVHNHDYNHPAA